MRSRLSAPRRHEPSEPPRAVRSATSRHGASTLLFLSSLGTLVRPVIFPRENNQKCVPYPERNEHHAEGVRVHRHLAHVGRVLYGTELGSVTLKINNQQRECVRGALRTSRKPLGFFSKLYLVNSVRVSCHISYTKTHVTVHLYPVAQSER